MKKILLAAIVLISGFNAMAYEPSEKVLEAFQKTFQHVQDVSWTENANTYEVKFRQDEVVSKVTYDKDGNIVRTLRYYYEQQLPIVVLAKVKAKFSDKKIYGVTEESSDAGTLYHIILEDSKHWINITSDIYGSVRVEKRFNKA